MIKIPEKYKDFDVYDETTMHSNLLIHDRVKDDFFIVFCDGSFSQIHTASCKEILRKEIKTGLYKSIRCKKVIG